MVRQVTLVAWLIAGIALIVLGATWKYWHSPQMLWTREQATEYTDAWRALKAVATGGVRRGDPSADPKLAAAQARFDAIDAKLQRARAFNEYTGTTLCAVGIALTIAGARFYWSRDRSAAAATEA